MKGSDIKDYILYNFMYMKFCTVESYGDKKQIYDRLGPRGMGGINCKEAGWKFGGDQNVLYYDRAGGHMVGYVVKTHQIINLKLVNFIIGILYPNKADQKMNRKKNLVRKTEAEIKHC